MREPLVSVVIPTYNRAKTIKETIFSVLNQTYACIEIIVIDDASVDDTEDIVTGIADDRIYYEKNEKRFLNMILQGCHTCLGCHIGYITKQNKRRFQICVDVIAIDVELVMGAAGIADADANALVYAIVQE